MTLEEKAALCTGASAWTTTPVERLGVPELLVSDGPHGVRRVPDIHAVAAQSLPATCFPTASLLASTWDAELLQAMGEALATEAVALGANVLLGPGVNMKRTPLCGRNFEYFSEDPYHAGELASALVEGIQSKGVGTSLKHFAANNQESERFSIDAVVDERTLREIYLPAFERVVKRAKPWTVMCAYNKLNGTYCSEHYTLLTEILREEWGYEGLVVSDWGAVHDRVAALQGGLDLEMPGPKPHRTAAVVEAVRAGTLDEAVLDKAVRHILQIVFRGAETRAGGTFDAAAHHVLARKVAAEGMVLLKNDGILPLRSVDHIAVIGRSAKAPHYQGGGSSHINPTQVDSPFESLMALAGDAEVTYSEGYPADDSFQQSLIDGAAAAAQVADVALLYIALPSYKESEGYDRADIDLTAQQIALIRAVSAVQPRCVVILNNGSAVAMSEWIDGVAAVLEAWMMGQAGGGAIADVLFGAVNPSGKLAESFPLKLADTPAHINFPGDDGQVRYGEGLFIGYRYYDARQMPVLFPFGYGLSYTTFAYSNATVSAATFRDVDGVTVSVDVTNTGSVAGKEVVQLYVHDRKSKLVRPFKELKGFAKVDLEPGETKRVDIALDFRAFAYYHPGYAQWITEDGDFDLLIGASSADIRATVSATLQTTLDLPSRLDKESTVQDWMDDPRGRAVFEPTFQLMMAQMAQAFGGGDGNDDGAIGMDMTGFIMQMPLASILGFQEALLPMPADVIVEGLLHQVHGA
ncbi:MAG: glycoside hydrolase family 3 C-terminal domain-containing protein [Caldilineaceae bacterium]|nr:glycoside hydrolase family 3 C-terminal domain-containing protein [Caldilinea sp.]MCB9117084.1 glycoside hydrolase family 3 C-terminal domain-containing protein [Caldilineaceae bacterium]MCB9118807.1 glycoside hydrolase family 3 C-terminal domain-containing protein [Caldilineaceae bacterium]MCB9125003.1 glycoside hydrolase family 3 C-terminal domain-containing protein [Caldilineaceae bacterium]